MDEPIEEVYFNWLYTKVASVEVPTPSLTYWTLLRDLHATEFVWLVSGDDNRAEDGLDIRREFVTQAYLDQDPAWMSIGCSVLEMLIGFARRAEFQTGISVRDWFWIFLQNLKLEDLNDAVPDITEYVTDILDQFLWRTYDPNGEGGMFPLDNPQHDQRKVEIWYQFCEWIAEQQL
jgi:hypothetical protein